MAAGLLFTMVFFVRHTNLPIHTIFRFEERTLLSLPFIYLLHQF